MKIKDADALYEIFIFSLILLYEIALYNYVIEYSFLRTFVNSLFNCLQICISVGYT